MSAANTATTTSPSPSPAVSHHRSASDDAEHHRQLSLIYDEQRYSYNSPVSSGRGDGGRTPRGHPRLNVTVSRRDTMPPIHLLSATNEAKSGVVLPQQLPFKLESTDSATRRPRWTSVPSSRSPSDSQPVFEDPEQDSSGTTDQQLSVNSAEKCEFSTGDREGDVSGLSDLSLTKRSAALLPTTTGLRQSPGSASTTVKYPVLGTSPSASSVVKQHAGTSSIMSKSSPSASSMLPMKLAEKPRPKSASSPPVQPANTSVTMSSKTTHAQTSTTGGTSLVSSIRSRTSPRTEQIAKTSAHTDSCSPQHMTSTTSVSNPAQSSSLQRESDIIYF